MNQSEQPNPIEKGYEGKEFSYTSPHDSWGKRQVIRTLEWLTGRNYLQRIYDELHRETPNPFDVWENAMNKLNITMDFDAAQLEKVPRSGPVIFIANHPFGVVDGVYLLHLVTRVRRDFFLLVNEVLSHEPIMEGHLLPVDFRNNDEALQTNLETKEHTTARLRQGEALAIFPSGGVATAMKFFGEVEELPWRKFICTRIHETKCSVVPIYFYGRNSRLFQFVSKLSMNMRLGLLLHEIMNKRGKRLRAEIGDPIHYPEMAPYPDRQDLIDYLQRRTMALKQEGQDHF
ncbi:MAG: lysophospholipid acyltransferase family protein [Phaeodactylibacter sp.]|nr:lysophospholipid acyltransferase family protein [Phaeodactylibacter sp.]